IKGEFKINRVELKELSKNQLKGHWITPVLLTLTYGVLSIVLSMLQDEASSVITIILIFTLIFGLGVFATVGIPNFYLEFIKKTGSSTFKDVLVSSNKMIKSLFFTLILSVVVFITTFIMIFLVTAGTVSFIFSDIALAGGVALAGIIILVFTILIIIFELALLLTPYIIIEHDNLSTIEAMSLSIKMMKGNKWKYFIIELSFIGWAILSILTFGIGFLWLSPYISLTQANFYKDLTYNNLNG
ncbi:MAG: DUF975 family protein, partial [Peptostreptococcaceae bacterium]